MRICKSVYLSVCPMLLVPANDRIKDSSRVVHIRPHCKCEVSWIWKWVEMNANYSNATDYYEGLYSAGSGPLNIAIR